MTTLFRSRQRAEDFAARVDGTATALRAVPAGSSADDDRLLGVVTTLRRQGDLDELATPREAFSLELRELLMTEAAKVLAPQQATLTLPVRTHGKRERRLVAAASAVILFGGTAGMAAAAQSALPGEALYPIKRGIEKADVQLSTSSAARGRDLLEQASGRLDEVNGLIEVGPAAGAPQIPGTLEAFSTQAREGADQMIASYQATGDAQSIVTLREFTARDLGSLEDLSGSAPQQAQAGLRDAALALRDIDSRASTLCPDCGDLPELKVPEVFLASAEVARALRAVPPDGLDNSHPVIVPKDAVRRGAKKPAGSPSAVSPSPPLTPPSIGSSPPEAPGLGGPQPPNGSGTGGNGSAAVNDTLKGVDGLAKGIGDVVDTLLPDAGDKLLP